MKTFTAAILPLYTLAPALGHSRKVEKFSLMPFGMLTIYVPDGRAESVTPFISGDGGWNKGLAAMAEHVASQRAIVVGISIVKYYKNIRHSAESCFYPAGDLETSA